MHDQAVGGGTAQQHLISKPTHSAPVVVDGFSFHVLRQLSRS